MNAKPAGDELPAGSGRPPVRRRLTRLIEPAVPRQYRRGAEGAGQPEPDPLEHRDAGVAADAAAAENLLRCWVREQGVAEPENGTLRLLLPASGACLRVPVRYWSASGWHRFGRPVLHGAPKDAPPVDAVTLASLLSREAAYAAARAAEADGTRASAASGPSGGGADLVGRVADSVRHTAVFLAARRTGSPPATADPFLTGEQSLLLGHPLHPTPKSREGLSEAEARRYSPELRGSFPLHWLAVHDSVLACDSAWTERGKGVPARELAARLAGPGLRVPPGCTPLPVHPWQVREVRERPGAAALFDAGLLRDLGAHGDPWHPTASVRTLYRPGAPAMLKLSLGVRITNSRRENLRKELHRGTEVHRLLRSGLGKEWQASFPGGFPGTPGFDVVRDPAWLAVDSAGGEPVAGLDAVVRHQPFAAQDDAVCIAALTSPVPRSPKGTMRSRLQEVVERLAGATGQRTAAVAAEWFLRYLEVAVRPVMWLDSEAGVALEAHQQNTVLLLDSDGWPAGGRYRDNQGYYFRESRRTELERRLPGLGAASDTFVPDDVTDERFAYYVGVNNVLGLVGAFGAAGLVDERVLLAAFRRFLEQSAAGAGPGRGRCALAERLLSGGTLRCKANLLTRVHGLDELVGPVDTQSVYVTVPNPLIS
ncbi:IucA/IucC family protein [Streptomyces sp. MAR4 CNY-716]